MLVASRSILAFCDHKVGNPESESGRIPTTFPTRGESVYIHPTALTKFINNYLPRIQFPFVLVSGDSDMTIPTDCQHSATIILNHPLLLEWYAQNCVSPSGKLKQLPIGLDFHTLARGHHQWGPRQSVQSQEEDIAKIRANSPHDKKLLCYANFQFLMNTRYGADRRQAMSEIHSNLVYYEPHTVPRIQSWQTMSQYKFVISPHGNGLDCHRTWEALALGCIPIVKSGPLDSMFSELPVLIVKEWNDVTADLLTTWNPTNTSLDKLMLSYWDKLINKHK